MQTLVQVVCTPGLSVRDAIANDPEAGHSCIRDRAGNERRGRAPGWTKLRSRAQGRRGSINIQWSAATKVLSCRVVNKRARQTQSDHRRFCRLSAAATPAPSQGHCGVPQLIAG